MSESSNQKQIKINMEDFNFNTTRKKKKDKPQSMPGIKIKTPLSKPKIDTLKKRALLKMIRRQQEDRYNKLFDTSSGKVSSETNTAVSEIIEMDSELEKAKEYLNNLKEKQDKKTTSHNTTLKLNSNIQPILPLNNLPLTNVSSQSKSTRPTIDPHYGCLKNGSLPTYRTYMKTSKNQPVIQIGNPVPFNHQQQTNQVNIIGNHADNINQPTIISTPTIIPDLKSAEVTPNIIDTKLNDSIKRLAELKQSEIILKREQNKRNPKPKRMMQKRIIRRTYKIGRSTTLPKIAVLVSNRTIRNNTSTKSQLLKQTSMNDVKRHLIKRGLIRVGSTTPNDVLRKMYESTMLMCGDVQNHNADNLLYNFINGENEH